MIAGLVRQLDSFTQVLGALGSDLTRPFAGERDWFEMRDPEYIRRTLPGMKLTTDLYFRTEVRGLENIPAEGPVLLVGNHSGGILIVDTFAFAQAFYDHFGPARSFYQLAHDLVFKVPGTRAILSRWGTVPASPAWRSSTACRSCRSWRSAARRRRCSSGAGGALRKRCS